MSKELLKISLVKGTICHAESDFANDAEREMAAASLVSIIGLDKNGNPVWEGDIVRYRTTDERFKKNPQYAVKVINYKDNSARFQAGNIYHQDLRSARLTVLGNIFDHSNLYPETLQNQN